MSSRLAFARGSYHIGRRLHRAKIPHEKFGMTKKMLELKTNS